MNDPRWTRIESLFDAALDLPEAERDAWLTSQCGDEPGLLNEVRAMLDARDGTGILDRPVVPAGPDTLEALQSALAGRYVIDRELGSGGMATVFLAHELKHDRPVVLKVLRPEVARLYGHDRFLREVQIAARLAHPHILSLLDSGEAGDLLFYVMPYAEGHTLRERLRDGPIPVSESLVLLRDIADALAYAHRQGVIHRDLKPDNVLCVRGHAFLMDFGVAKHVEPARRGVTREGVAIGTPAYMAPEQAAGSAVVGDRADVYAWGLLAYELVTGQSLFAHAASAALGAEFGVTHPSLPGPLADLVRQCLERDPEHRPDSTTLVHRLENLSLSPGARPGGARRFKVVLAAGGGALALLLAWWGLARTENRVPMPYPVAVAVFENETGDSTLAIWGRLAGDWITQGLQETGLVPVVAWPTARQAGGAGPDRVATLREATGAGTIVTGTYYLVGHQVRFQAAVIDAATGQQLVAPEPVDAPRDSVEQALRLLRERVMGAIAIRFDERFRAIPGLTGRPPTFEAYRAADLGLERYNDQQYRAAIPEFERALALDSTFTAAAVPLAFALWNTGQFDRLDSALRSLRARGLQFSPYHEHQVRQLEAMLTGDGAAALRAIRRAYDLAPAGRAGYNVAVLELRLNRPADALRTLEALDPDGPALQGWSSYWTQLCHALHQLGLHDREAEAARQLAARFPDRRVALALEARALAAAGRTAAVDSAIARAAGLTPDTFWSQGAAMVIAAEELLAHGWPEEGRTLLERAVRWLANQLARTPDHESHRAWMGEALYQLGAWNDAAPYFDGLAREFPDRLAYRGWAALVAARRGDRGANDRLGPPPRWNQAEYWAFRGRLAAALGEADLAFGHLGEALRSAFEGLVWLHATAVRDVEGLRDDPRFPQVFGPEDAGPS